MSSCGHLEKYAFTLLHSIGRNVQCEIGVITVFILRKSTHVSRRYASKTIYISVANDLDL